MIKAVKMKLSKCLYIIAPATAALMMTAYSGAYATDYTLTDNSSAVTL